LSFKPGTREVIFVSWGYGTFDCICPPVQRDASAPTTGYGLSGPWGGTCRRGSPLCGAGSRKRGDTRRGAPPPPVDPAPPPPPPSPPRSHPFTSAMNRAAAQQETLTLSHPLSPLVPAWGRNRVRARINNAPRGCDPGASRAARPLGWGSETEGRGLVEGRGGAGQGPPPLEEADEGRDPRARADQDLAGGRVGRRGGRPTAAVG